MALIVILTHLFYATVNAFTLYCMLVKVTIPRNVPMGDVFTGYAGWFKFMTTWNLIVQCVFFTLSFICDITSKRSSDPSKRNALQKFLDYFYAAITFPLAIFVFSVFWALFFIDRELVFPKALDAYFPWFLNHLMHTVILPFVLVEMILVKHQFPSRKSSLIGGSIFNLIYAVWVLFIYFVADLWVYPVLKELNWPGRIAFISGNFILFFGFYFIGETLNKLKWGKKSSPKGKKGKSN